MKIRLVVMQVTYLKSQIDAYTPVDHRDCTEDDLQAMWEKLSTEYAPHLYYQTTPRMRILIFLMPENPLSYTEKEGWLK